jgi:hypothetical protein
MSLDFSIDLILSLNVVQTGTGVHLTSYPMGTGSSFPGGKAAVV